MISNFNDGSHCLILTTFFDICNNDSDCISYTSFSPSRLFFSPMESSSIFQIVGDPNIPVSTLDESLVPSNHFKPIESVTDPLAYPHSPDTCIIVSNSFYYDFFDDACKQNNKNWMSESSCPVSTTPSLLPLVATFCLTQVSINVILQGCCRSLVSVQQRIRLQADFMVLILSSYAMTLFVLQQ